LLELFLESGSDLALVKLNCLLILLDSELEDQFIEGFSDLDHLDLDGSWEGIVVLSLFFLLENSNKFRIRL